MEDTMRNLTLEFFGRGLHKISPEEFLKTGDGFLLDVRSGEEAGFLSINMDLHPGLEAANIPIDQVPDRVNEIPREKLVAVFCPANVRASIVYAYLLSRGYQDVKILDGGYSALTGALKPGQVLKIVQGENKK